MTSVQPDVTGRVVLTAGADPAEVDRFLTGEYLRSPHPGGAAWQILSVERVEGGWGLRLTTRSGVLVRDGEPIDLLPYEQWPGHAGGRS